MDWNLPDDIHPDDIHGLSILMNDGNGSFTREQIVGVWGAYASTMHDVNNDGELDIVLSAFRFNNNSQRLNAHLSSSLNEMEQSGIESMSAWMKSIT